MYYQKVRDGYILRLESGESIIPKITEFILKEDLKSCTISGIGSVKEVVLAYYNLDEKRFYEKTFDENCELISLTGSVGFENSTPLVHLHASISDNNFITFGGHVKEMKIAATVELLLSTLDTRLPKSYNIKVGLKLFDLDCEFK